MLYAESLMLLNTERAFYRVSDPFVQSFHTVLEGVLEKDINHPGACHLYIHATEATEVAYKAEPCADLLMTAIPGASHINHMPSHTYNVIGRWGKAVRSNAMAWRSDERSAYGEGVSYAGTHNLHMLFFAGSMDGQGTISADAAEERARRAEVYMRDLLEIGDGEAAREQELTLLTHQARARLIRNGVLPLSRPELAAQLDEIGDDELAGRLRRALEERPMAA